MAARPLPNYLRTHRKRWALSQKQFAELLGFDAHQHLSKYELNERLPGLKTALACEIIFGVPVKTLFAGLHREIEEEVMRRAHALYQRVEHADDPKGIRHHDLVMDMLARAISQPKLD
jgi:transcriptional regulator with XRE-family HTH domain